MKKIKSAAVLGLGQFGISLALEFMEQNVQVLAADINPSTVERIASKVTYAVTADLTDAEAINELGLKNMDIVIICMSQNIEATIMCIVMAKEAGVPEIIAKAASKRTVDIYKKVGADRVVQPEAEHGRVTARKLMASNFIEFFGLSEDINIVEMYPKEDWVGYSISQLELRKKHRINVVAIVNEDKLSNIADPDIPLQSDDRLLIAVNNDDINKLIS